MGEDCAASAIYPPVTKRWFLPSKQAASVDQCGRSAPGEVETLLCSEHSSEGFWNREAKLNVCHQHNFNFNTEEWLTVCW